MYCNVNSALANSANFQVNMIYYDISSEHDILWYIHARIQWYITYIVFYMKLSCHDVRPFRLPCLDFKSRLYYLDFLERKKNKTHI